MVAIVSGSGLGLDKSSANVLGARGQLGSAALGRANDGVTINAANGNLIINNRDEVLIGRGADSVVNRTYNSLGQFTDENGDNWANYYSRVVNHVGSINTAGAYLDRLDWDGGTTRYYFDAGKGLYVSKEGAGSFDVIGYDSGWWWRDGDSGIKEVYGAAQDNRVVSIVDRDGNAITYSYAGNTGNLARITTAEGGYTDFTWSRNNLASLTTAYTDAQTGLAKTLTRTRYSYDGYNRLATVTTDLTPDDNSIADGRTYTTTYSYAGASKLVSSIAQTDGSLLTFSYDGSNRVVAFSQTVENGVTRTTNFAYGANYTNITDPQGNITTMYFDGAPGLLTTLREPDPSGGPNPLITNYGYDADGNVTTVFVNDGWSGPPVSRDWYRYDANGNMYDRYQWVDGGYLVTKWFYGAQNQLLTSTRYTGVTAAGHGGTEPTGGMTTRYVYDAEMHLRFVASPEGRVTEYRYDTPGNRIAEINYTLNAVGTVGVPENFSWSEQDFINWLASYTDKSTSQRIDTGYDFRGNVQSVTTYSKVDAAGYGILAAGYSRTIFVYDQYGNLLSKQSANGEPTVSLTELTGWGSANLTSTPAGAALNGKPATQFTVQTTGAWTAFASGVSVADGDTYTTSVTLKGTGTSPSISIGIYGNTSSWGANQHSAARIISGPGTISQEVGGLWNVTGLSNSEETRVEIVRNFAQGDVGGGVYAYVDRPSGSRAGQGLIVSDPVVTKTRDVTETYAYDGMGRQIRYTDAKGVGTWTTYVDPQARTVVTLASGLTQTSTYNRLGELTAFDETRIGAANELVGAQSLAGWGVGGLTTSAAGTIDGSPATKYTVPTGSTWSGTAYGFSAVAGETYTASISLQAVGSQATQYFGIYGDQTGWGSLSIANARIVSGPGKIGPSPWNGALWEISGLSTTEATRIEISRTYTQSETGGAYLYVDLGGSFRAGQELIASAPSIIKSRYDGASAFSGSSTDLRRDLNDPNQYSAAYITKTPGGALGAEAATKLTINAGQSYGATYSNATPVQTGDTLTYSFSVMAIGGNTTQLFGLYGDSSGWGDLNSATFRIISGPGTLSAYAGYGYGGLSYITGLSTTQATRVEVTRTYTRNEGAYGYIYALSANSSPGDVSYVAGASLTRSRGNHTAFTYDNLGRQRVKIDPAGARTYYLYDRQSRKVADIAANGALVEYKYDATGNVVATIAYQTALSAGQLASLVDDFNNPTAVEFASLRPAATASDRWAWNVYDRAGRAIETIDAYGGTTEFVYDAAGRIKYSWKRYYQLSAAQLDGFKVTPPATRTVPADYAAMDRINQYYYDNQGLLVGTMDADGYLTQNVYDAAGRQIDSVRYWNLPNLANRLTDSFATLLGSAGTSVYDARNSTLYDSRGLVGATIDAEGNVTRMTYDARGNVARQERGQKVPANTLYTLATLPAASGQLQVTNFVRDVRGQVSSQTQQLASGNLTSTFSYNAIGTLSSATDARGNQTYKYYDAKGRLVREEAPLDIGGSTWAVTRYEYDSRGNVIKVIDPRGNASYNYYDERSRLVLAIDAEGYATEKSYTVLGDVAWVRRYYVKPSGTGNPALRPTLIGDAKDATTSFAYDLLGRMTSANDAEGKSETFYYNTFSEKYAVVNKLGGGEYFYYTKRGQLYYSYTNEEVRRNDGSIQLAYRYKSLYDYDARGNVSRMVEGYALTERRDTYYSYDRNNRLIQKTLPQVSVLNINTDGETSVTPTETYNYDARGNLIESVDGIGSRTLYYYDEANRKIAEISATGTHKTYSYDLNGNVLVERVYGAKTTLPATAGGTAPAPQGAPREVYYAYDRANRLIEKRIPAVQKTELVGTVLQRSGTDIVTSIIYDFQGNVAQEIDGRGNSIFHYYDKNGREIAKVDQENYITAWTRDSEGNVFSETRFANQYGAAAVIGTIPTVAASGADRTTNFTYDKMGRRLTETRLAVSASSVSGNSVSTTSQNATITYTYNEFGEVLSKTESSGDRTDYTYDTYGRMTSRREAGFVNDAWANVRLTTDLYYDGLNSLVYERPSELNTGALARSNRYTYGAGGRLASMTDTNGFTRNYKYDAAGRVVEERYTRTKSNGTTTVVDAKYTTYDAVGRVTSQYLATYDGGWTYMPTATTTYNAYGDVAMRGVAGAATEQMFYDNAGRVNMSSAGDGIWKFFAYDANGNVTVTMTSTAVADLGHWNGEYAFNILTGSATVDVANFNQYYTTVSVVLYDRRNSAVATYEPNRTVAATDVATTTTQTLNTHRWYNAFGEVSQEKSARGYFTNYSYNTMGRVTQVQAPEITVTFENGSTARQRPTENYAYDLSGRLVGTQNANGFWTTRLLLAGTGYEGKEAVVVTEYRADGSSIGFGYDVYGNQKWARDGLNRYTYSIYDNANRLIQTTRPSGNAEYYGYNELGQRTQHWNNWYGTTIKELTDYDAQGRVTSTKTYANETTSFAYSWNPGTPTNGLGTFGGWTKTTYRPDGYTASETTDVFGRMVARTDLGGRVYTYNYNEAGQLASQTSTGGQSISYTYFNTGRLAAMNDNAAVAAGYSTSNIDATYTYDADGNRTYERLAGTTSYYDPYQGYYSVTTVYQDGKGTYDEKGNLLTFTDAGASGNGAVSITNAYDAAGNVRRTQATHAIFAANQTLGGNITDDYWYKYDALNRMTLVKGSLINGDIIRGTIESRSITYDAAGQRATQSRTMTGYSAYLSWGQESREIYTYNADGNVSQLNIALGTQAYASAQGGPVPWAAVTPATGSGIVRAVTAYDGMNRVTNYTEYDTAGTSVFNRYGIYYDYRGAITQESSTTRRTENDGYLYVNYSTINNSYGTGGLLTYSSSTNYRYKNGTNYQDTPDTTSTYGYAYWDSPMQATLSFRPNTSQSTTYQTSYTYDYNGHLTTATINDGRSRSVTYINDAAGQILSRTEADNVGYNVNAGTGGDPKTVWWFFDGKQVGSTSNNGNDDPDYEAATAERLTPSSTASTAPFRLGQTSGVSYSDFDQAYNSLSPGEGGGAGSAYVVRQGDTLSSIAQAVYGDASLWYMIADQNGLKGAAALIAGQSITIPAKLANVNNRSDTYRVYDANRAIGDTQPTTPAPPKKPKCGVFGQILLAVIAAAVTYFTAGAAAAALGPVLGGAASAAAGSIASQIVGVATGIQDKFSFKAVALAALGGAVGGALGPGGLAKNGLFGAVDKAGNFAAGALGGIKSGFIRSAVNGALGSAVSQGIGVATGLQDKFSWGSVAAAGVASGVGYTVGKALNIKSMTKTQNADDSWTQGNISLDNIARNGVTGMARALASGAAQSIVEGTDFGDNVLAALPGEIGNTIGMALVGGIEKGAAAAAARRQQKIEKESNKFSNPFPSFLKFDESLEQFNQNNDLFPGFVGGIEPTNLNNAVWNKGEFSNQPFNSYFSKLNNGSDNRLSEVALETSDIKGRIWIEYPVNGPWLTHVASRHFGNSFRNGSVFEPRWQNEVGLFALASFAANAAPARLSRGGTYTFTAIYARPVGRLQFTGNQTYAVTLVVRPTGQINPRNGLPVYVPVTLYPGSTSGKW
jgi:YD repeat-containing protein